jgi:ParB family transcriptional regulator, chromosome partitioning protein
MAMQIKINDIKVNNNRRKVDEIKVKELAESILEIGLINPITVTKNNILIAGAHRLNAVRLLGMDSIECSVVNIDGLMAELVEIDENLIRNELHYIDRGDQLKRRKEIYESLYPKSTRVEKVKQNLKQNIDTALSAPSEILTFTEDVSKKTGQSIRKIREDIQIASKINNDIKQEIKDLDIPKKESIRIAKLEPTEQKQVIEKLKNKQSKKVGQAINQIKQENKLQELKASKDKEINGKIINDDLFNAVNQIDNNSIDLLCTDPPYMVLDEDWDSFNSIDEFMNFTKNWLDAVMPKVKSTGRVYICFSQSYQFDLYNLLKDNDFYGFNFGQSIIWNYKNNNKCSDRKIYRYTYDVIFYLYGKDAGTLNLTDDTYGEAQTSVWTVAIPQTNFNEGKYHPAQKPIELIENIIKTGSKENDIILDCFAGSGTAGVVCEKLNRKYILIEKSKEYCDVIRGRLNGI